MNGSLFELSTQVRKIALVILAVMLIIVGGDALLKFLNSPSSPFFTVGSAYLEANSAFGTLPVPKIPTLAIDDASLPTFAVDGVFGQTPDSVLVYKMEEPREKLDTIDKAIKAANAVGFTAAYSEATEGDLNWENATKSRSLKFNRTLNTWRMRTQYFVDIEAARAKTVRDDLTFYEGKGKSISSTIGFTDKSLAQGKTIAKLAKLGINGLFTNPLAAASSDYVTIDIFRKFDLAKVRANVNLNNYPTNRRPKDFEGFTYTNDPRIGSMHMVVTGQVADLTKEVYEFDFTNYEYNYNYAVYRVISPSEAWDRVRQGGGALTLLQPQGADYFSPSQVLNVTRFVADAPNVEIGYWEPPITDTNRYVYPIYVFRGRAEFADNKPAGQFVFYVDALVRN